MGPYSINLFYYETTPCEISSGGTIIVELLSIWLTLRNLFYYETTPYAISSVGTIIVELLSILLTIIFKPQNLSKFFSEYLI
jgi:hypothetical protein